MFSGKRIVYLAALLAVVLGGCNRPGDDVEQSDPATIGDYTWLDENLNGIQDEGEGPLPGIEVRLYSSDQSQLLDSTTSDDQGFYEFDPEAGEYRLMFEQPPDLAFTEKDAQQNGREDEDSDVFSSGNDQGWTDVIVVLPAVNAEWDAGYVPATVPPTATPTPIGRIESPTGVPVTPTPANPSGQHLVQVVVQFDDAGHVTFVALADADGNTTVLLDLTDAGLEMNFSGTNPQSTSVTLFGPMDPDGNVDAVGSGVVAGFQNVSASFVGAVTVDADGTVHINGELTLGGNAELPQGQPIIYDISS